MAGERSVGEVGPKAVGGAADIGAAPTVKWDDTGMRTGYANVVNVASTREEVVLLFGVNQAWQAGQQEVTVQLTDRMILSPLAARRLAALLARVLREHEARFGPLSRPSTP